MVGMVAALAHRDTGETHLALTLEESPRGHIRDAACGFAAAGRRPGGGRRSVSTCDSLHTAGGACLAFSCCY